MYGLIQYNCAYFAVNKTQTKLRIKTHLFFSEDKDRNFIFMLNTRGYTTS